MRRYVGSYQDMHNRTVDVYTGEDEEPDAGSTPMVSKALSVWDFAILTWHRREFSLEDFALSTGFSHEKAANLLERAYAVGWLNKTIYGFKVCNKPTPIDGVATNAD